MAEIVVYGADWCEDTAQSREKLDGLGVPYRYVNVEEDPDGKQLVLSTNNGRQKTPTITFPDDGPALVEPSDEELENRLRRSKVVS